MPEQTFEQLVLERLEKQAIEPKAKWKFTVHHVVVVGFGVIFVVLGGIATAVIMYMLQTNDWDVYEYIYSSFWGFLFGTLPYVWLAVLSALIVGGYFYVRKTEQGYRYNFWLVVGGLVVTSCAIGGVLHALGIGERLNTVFAEHVPQYTQMADRKAAQWVRPEEGRLGGVILEINSPEQFELRDFNKQKWHIIIVDPMSIEPQVVFEGNRVRMVGQQVKPQTFEAMHILPFNGQRMQVRQQIIQFQLKTQPMMPVPVSP